MNAKRSRLVTLVAVSAGLLIVIFGIRSFDATRHPAETLEQIKTVRTDPIRDVAVAQNDATTGSRELPPRPLRRIPARSAQPLQLLLTLDDGTELPVSIRPFRMSSIVRPERLADVYADLRRLAQNGDASAGYSLHRWLKECGRAHADEASLSKAVTRVRTEGVMTLGNGETRPTNDVVRAEASLNQVFAFCQGISQEQRDESPAWLAMAASTGELFALRAQADELRHSPDQFVAAYKELWYKHGYSGALSPLAIMYKRGFAGGQPDYVQVYAFQFAEFKLVERVYGQSVYPSHRNMLVAMEDSVRNTGSYLTPQETQQATELGVRLLKENQNCCVGLIFGTTY